MVSQKKQGRRRDQGRGRSQGGPTKQSPRELGQPRKIVLVEESTQDQGFAHVGFLVLQWVLKMEDNAARSQDPLGVAMLMDIVKFAVDGGDLDKMGFGIKEAKDVLGHLA